MGRLRAAKDYVLGDIAQIQQISNQALDEAMAIIKDEVDRVLDELGRIVRGSDGELVPAVAGGVSPNRMETEPPVRGNEPMQSTGGSGSSGLPTSGLRNKYKDLLSGNTAHSKFLNDELDRIDALPSGANKAQEITLFEENLRLTEEFKGTFKKSDKYDKFIKRTGKAADKFEDESVAIRRRQGKGNKTPYHGRLPKELEEQVMRNPDAVYVSTGNENNIIFFKKDGHVVVSEGVGSGAGDIITSYGPSGPRGESGAAIFGGNANDPGLPVTEEIIIKGQIKKPNGDYIAPAIRIK